MKKVLKFSYRAITILLVVLIVAGAWINKSTEDNSGYYSSVTSPMTASDKQWVHDTFGGYETFEEFLYEGLIKFAIKNFVYDDNYNHYFLVVQRFNFNEFRQDDFHGVCYQFAQFAKSVVLELYGKEVKSFVCDVRLNRNFNKTHSYNYFIIEDADGNKETYFVDLTSVLSHYKKNIPYGCCAKKIGDVSFEYYSEKVLNDDVYRIY